jgi:elongation factor Ts
MAIDLQTITRLREMTGAGISDVKGALDEAAGDTDKAIEILRKKGAIKAAKKSAERTAGDGIIESYIHSSGKVGVLVEVRCETDFVARTDEFKAFVHDIAIQIAGANPLYVTPEEVPDNVIAKEREIYTEQLRTEGKPAEMIEKIMDGKVKKFYTEVCLLEQLFVKDDSVIIKDLISQKITTMGEKIEVTRFARFQI